LKENRAGRVLVKPRGPVFYEDPVLESAWQLMQTAREARVSAAAEGEDLDNRLLHWIPYVIPLLRGRFKRTRETLAPHVPERDVNLTLPARIAIFGDAGYRGLAQRRVFEMIEKRHEKAPFNALIHLGDTYHGGGEAEMLRHLLAPLADLGRALKLTGSVFSLCGNHDLYDGPEGYLGVLEVLGQPGRYFSIEAGSWRIACLDSALGDTSLRCMDGKVDEAQLRWLKKKQKDKKRLITLTHHLPLSAWDKAPTGMTAQIRQVSGLVAWYWGHEHRCAGYRRDNPTDFIGGCVGNGAFLEEWSEPNRKRQQRLEWYPRNGRCTCFSNAGPRYWPHGFVELELDENRAVESFWLENGKQAASSRKLI
jgi:hypothetical protein